MKKEFSINTNIKLKKSHVCGSEVWEIKKIGEDSKIKIYPYSNLSDYELQCVKCKRNIKMNYQEIIFIIFIDMQYGKN